MRLTVAWQGLVLRSAAPSPESWGSHLNAGIVIRRGTALKTRRTTSMLQNLSGSFMAKRFVIDYAILNGIRRSTISFPKANEEADKEA